MGWKVLLFILASLTWPAGAGAQSPQSLAPDPSGGRESPAALIRPGDQVSIRIFREPDLGGQFTVSESGTIVLPRLGTVEVCEMTVTELQASLVSGYAEFLRSPSVEMTVLRRIGIHGEVRRPDVYMLDLTVTLRDALARAGGVTEAGHPGRITIIRGDEHIQVGDDAEARFLAAELRSGDQIVVGRRSWMALNPAVAVSTATGLVSFVIGIVLLVR